MELDDDAILDEYVKPCHAQQRALERFNLGMTREELLEICDRIDFGEGVLLERREPHIGRYLIRLEGTYVRVVYNSLRRIIVTFLPESVYDYMLYDLVRQREEH